MAKQVMLAVAGAGKTYYICDFLQLEKKNLILAYTHENIKNIQKELIMKYGYVPELTNVMTFDSFIYRFLLCPYEPSILKYFGREDFKRKGITTQDPPVRVLSEGKGKYIPNPKYISKDKFEHYINNKGYYYCSTLTELIMFVKQNRVALIRKASKSIKKFYDNIFIDEFQDFREHDYELIIALAKNVDNILMVGDYYQHSVSAVNNTGKPFKNRDNDISYTKFKQNLIDCGLKVDDVTLKNSRRCCPQVCDFVKEKLNINIESSNEHSGKVLWVEKNIESVLEDDTIIKLIYNNAETYTFRAINWSYSKGDTMDAVCVILTRDFEFLDKHNFSLNGISSSTVNRLYVAMTRTKGDLYLLKGSLFKSIKGKYRVG